MGVSDLLKPQNPGKVVVLAESGTCIFAYKSSSAYMLSEGCGTIVICMHSKDAEKQLGP